MSDPRTPLGQYDRLLAYAAGRLGPLGDRHPGSAKGRFIAAACADLAYHTSPLVTFARMPSGGPAYDFVDVLADSTDLDHPNPMPAGLWKRLMLDWPMGAYPAALMSYLGDSIKPGQHVLEVGAGVGNLTRPLVERLPESVTLTRTDLHTRLVDPEIAPGAIVPWDFNTFSPIAGGFDLIVGCNAVHCAADLAFTVRQLRRMLRTGGRLVLVEGAPYTPTPWALTAPFGMLDGWWDRGGFRTPYDWARVGLSIMEPVIEGAHRVGYVLEAGA